MCVCCALPAVQLERESALREAALASAHDEVAALKDELRGQAATLQQQLLELAAYQRQVRLGRVACTCSSVLFWHCIASAV